MICSCSVDTTAFVAIMTKADLNLQRPFSCGDKLHFNVSNDLFSSGVNGIGEDPYTSL